MKMHVEMLRICHKNICTYKLHLSILFIPFEPFLAFEKLLDFLCSRF